MKPCFVCDEVGLCEHREPELVEEINRALLAEEGWRAKESVRRMKWGDLIAGYAAPPVARRKTHMPVVFGKGYELP